MTDQPYTQADPPTETKRPYYSLAELRVEPFGPTRADLDAVYRERAHLVAHLAALYPAVLVAAAPDAPEWAIVYVTLPTGQASWHIAVRDLPLFAEVEVVPADSLRAIWDQHTTDEKYARLDDATALVLQDRDELGEIEADAARMSEPLLDER